MIRTTLALALCASLHAAPIAIHPVEEARIDVSHSIGFPLGGLGTGYVAFGQYGFVHEFLGDREPESMSPGTWEYTAKDAKESAAPALAEATKRLEDAKSAATPPASAVLAKLEKSLAKAKTAANQAASPVGFAPSKFGFVIRDIPGETVSVLQTTQAPWLPEAAPFQSATASALPPKGRVVFTDPATELEVTVDAFSPLLPHDLATATLPVIVADVTVKNTGAGPRRLALSLEHGSNATPVEGKSGRIEIRSDKGSLAFASDGAESVAKGISKSVFLSPGGTETSRFCIAWHYPKVENYTRY